MKKYKTIYILMIYFGFLLACNKQQSSKPIKEQPIINTTLDTIKAKNAPQRITRKVKQDQDGNLLLASYEDIIKFDGTTFTKLVNHRGVDSLAAFAVLEDKNGQVWIGSTHFGLFHNNGRAFRQWTRNEGLVNNRIMCLYEDRKGLIWIGTQGGLSTFDGEKFRNFTTDDGLSHNDVSTILEDKSGQFWIGTRGKACIYNPNALPKPAGKLFKEILISEGKPLKNIWSIIEDKNGYIWLAGQDGLWRYNGSTYKNYTSDFISCVYEDKKGNIWTSSPQGALMKYEQKSLQDEKALPMRIVQTGVSFFGIGEDEIGNIYVGSLRGLSRYDGESISFYQVIKE